MPADNAFDLLHRGVQRQLWAMAWTELRPLQTDAIRRILCGDGHLVLAAATAAGKTEAAFLPILSAIADQPSGSVRAMYVGPLKALINDQFARVEELCAHLDMPVHRWHGDVSAGPKSKLVADPAGILLITPESLESLFINRSGALPSLFGGLRFIVIDELHSFLDNERGRHLRSLLHRVARIATQPPRLIGLSATLGDPLVAKAYLDPDRPDAVGWIDGGGDGTDLKLRVHAYVDSDPVNHDNADAPHPDLADDLIEHCRGQVNLVFANSRNDVEEYADLCDRLARDRHLPDAFLVHHGSLSADTRRETERTMKDASRTHDAVTTFCSSTLEMGIDIGAVRMVGQIGAPDTVASLKQRLGRSGRRADIARVLRIYLDPKQIDGRSMFFARLHLRLIQTIAMIRLLLSGWIEPPEPTGFDLSTLTQQIISLIAETGGVKADTAFDALCRSGVFRDVDATVFTKLLRQLDDGDVIDQMEGGDLILGLAGEKIRKGKSFYAAFMGTDGFAVIHAGHRIGSVDDAPRVGDSIRLSARRWLVRDVDPLRRVIYVVPASGAKKAPFHGVGAPLHPRIVREMRTVLASDDKPAYLDTKAVELLSAARRFAASADLCRQGFIALDARSTAVMTWTGKRTSSTLAAMFEALGVGSLDKTIAVVLERSIPEAKALIDRILAGAPDETAVLEKLVGLAGAKYDALLSPELRLESLRRRWLDMDSALAVLRELSTDQTPPSPPRTP